MRGLILACTFLMSTSQMNAADPGYEKELQEWREGREKSLREDNGWLTLAGRFPLKAGAHSFGTGAMNDIVFPPQLKGTGPERLGTLQVDPDAKQVKLILADGVTFQFDDTSFKGERVLKIEGEKREWIGIGRIRFHIIERSGRYILRLADNESLVRKNFTGRIWYPADEAYKVEAKFVPYTDDRKLKIVNVIEEVSMLPCPGYAEFKLKGETHKLDAIKDDNGLLFVIRDKTAGDTTYQASRFLKLEKIPAANETFTLDFNKAYNPPCAFCEFTTCPLPPKQNVFGFRIEAGEKYRSK
jgi:uncharacterized protein